MTPGRLKGDGGKHLEEGEGGSRPLEFYEGESVMYTLGHTIKTIIKAMGSVTDMPSEWRSSRWRALECTSPAAIWQLAEAVVPPLPGEGSLFFTTLARRLVAGVITSLNITQPGRWDLGGVVRIFDNRDYTTQVLSRTARTRHLLDLLVEEKM